MAVRFWRPPFQMGPEEKLFDTVKQFLDRVVESASNLEAATLAYVAGEERELRDRIAKVSDAEREADSAREVIEKTVFGGRFYDRSEKIEMIEKIDDVADNAQLAAQILLYKALKIPTPLAAHIRDLVAKTKRVVESLREAVIALYTDFSAVSPIVKRVEVERDAARESYEKIVQEIYASRLDARALMLLRDFTFRVIKTADSAEEAAGRVSFLAVRYG